MKVEDVRPVVNSLVRKYDWHLKQVGPVVRLTVNDGKEYASVSITEGEDIKREVERAIAAVDAHEYGEIEG